MATVIRSPDIETREQFGDLLNRRGLCGMAVEIGTELGVFAVQLLERWHGRQLVCVDPWRQMSDYPEMRFDRECDFVLAAVSLARFTGRVRIFRGTSEAAAKTPDLFPWPIDFVYLDGNHEYEAVKADLAAWWPKLSPFAILAGHDYDPRHPGVIRAVDEFADQLGVPVYLTRERDFASWYTWKADLRLAAARKKIALQTKLEAKSREAMRAVPDVPPAETPGVSDPVFREADPPGPGIDYLGRFGDPPAATRGPVADPKSAKPVPDAGSKTERTGPPRAE